MQADGQLNELMLKYGIKEIIIKIEPQKPSVPKSTDKEVK